MNSELFTYLRINSDGSRWIQAVDNLYYQIDADGTCLYKEIANPTIDELPFSFVRIDPLSEEVSTASTAPDGVLGCTEYFHDRAGSSGPITTAEEFMHWCGN